MPTRWLSTPSPNLGVVTVLVIGVLVSPLSCGKTDKRNPPPDPCARPAGSPIAFEGLSISGDGNGVTNVVSSREELEASGYTLVGRTLIRRASFPGAALPDATVDFAKDRIAWGRGEPLWAVEAPTEIVLGFRTSTHCQGHGGAAPIDGNQRSAVLLPASTKPVRIIGCHVVFGVCGSHSSCDPPRP